VSKVVRLTDLAPLWWQAWIDTSGQGTGGGSGDRRASFLTTLCNSEPPSRLDIVPPLWPAALVDRRHSRMFFLLLDPAIGSGFEQIERQHASVQHFVVKAADVELSSELLLGARA
jgi:hypothetical protein